MCKPKANCASFWGIFHSVELVMNVGSRISRIHAGCHVGERMGSLQSYREGKLWEPQPKKVEYHTPFVNAPVGSLAFLDQLHSENIRRALTERTYFWTISDQVTPTTRQLPVISTFPVLLRFDVRTRQSFKRFIVGGRGLKMCEYPVQVCLAEIVFPNDVRKYRRLSSFTTTITLWIPESTR